MPKIVYAPILEQAGFIKRKVSITDIGQRFIDGSKSTGYQYIVTGDSTRDSFATPSIHYYRKQLSKINFDVIDNSESGQSASDWLNNRSNANLNDAIAATSGTGANTILEMSLGINREAGQTVEDIKNDIVNGISSYLQEKPDTLIIFVSPNKFATSLDYEAIYEELAQQFSGSVFVSGYVATAGVYGNADFYADSTHPNEYGSKRVVNYIFSSTLPDAVVNLMTLENEYPVIVDPVIPSTVESGYFSYGNGSPQELSSWRRLSEINVEPNFTIRIDHGGNRFGCSFLDQSGNFIQTINSTVVSGEGYRTAQVPPNAYIMRANVSDDGVNYDAMNYNVTLTYEVDESTHLTQSEINAGLDIRMPIT